MENERPPMLYYYIVNIFKDNPEGFKIVKYYLKMEKEDAIKSLNRDMKDVNKKYDANHTAVAALQHIKNGLLDCTDSELFWIREKFKGEKNE